MQTAWHASAPIGEKAYRDRACKYAQMLPISTLSSEKMEMIPKLPLGHVEWAFGAALPLQLLLWCLPRYNISLASYMLFTSSTSQR